MPFVNSVASNRPVDNVPRLRTLRLAVAASARSLGTEVAKNRNTVNTIIPRYTRTRWRTSP